MTDHDGAAPAGLDRHLPEPGPRHVRTALTAVLLLLAAGAAMWAALDGVGPARFDARLLGEAVETRTGGLNTAAVTLTTVGNTFAMAVLATLTGIWCWTRGRRSDAVFVVTAMAGAVLLFRGVKVLVDRPRPPAVTQVVRETNESLPSGHATMSTVVIGSLVVLAWAGRSALARVAMVAAAALWVGAVGATRVYLGVHWFSDVVSGWLLGAAWLVACVAVWRWWRRRTHPTAAPA
ncbi:phosphatase PAP2 family protein [Pseudonocardia broussonetiae]|uniref:Phosphatase PAP2 family protein n=1 Tax=Pseudonocardia broussonetiae TaxID=2736640 RepID=A0A6M6JKD2_9PSEU|nr:phosphatase PAP2 family protein [Pseudonocardia broussonetiae]QJY47643.1 phosphatase PAP2 family protein [Pseudonocardia broussonetiae]